MQTPSNPLSILYHDESLIAVNKPSGLLVHRSPIDKQESVFALQTLRQQFHQKVYPIHRLDKPTSGVLLFALSSEIAKKLSADWHNVDKHYWAITRGKVASQLIDHPITTHPDKGDRFVTPKVQSAQTHIELLASATLAIGFGKSAKQYPQTTFSWVKASPLTGRKHQIRKHLKHINHPIVGDTRYGRGEINRYFRTHYAMNRLMLHCYRMVFKHPVSQAPLAITAPVDATWIRCAQVLSLDTSVNQQFNHIND